MPARLLTQRIAWLAVAAALVGAAVYAILVGVSDKPDKDTRDPAPIIQRTYPPPAADRMSGPGVTTVGVHLAAEPYAIGDLEVAEQVRFALPVRTLTLSPPSGLAEADAGDEEPQVTQLQVEINGQPVALPRTSMVQIPMRIELDEPTTEVTLRYRLVAAAVRSSPAPAGRVLVRLAPLTSDASPVLVDLVGEGVRNLVCPDLPAKDQVCGSQRGNVWTAGPLPAEIAAVVAQLDLPSPGTS
jgi:hypothetical protein